MAEMVNLTIDGHAISVPKGTTVYTAAKQLGIEIPIFCYHDRMPPFGACRMCLVEVEKMPKLQTSCTLECMEGMVVRTQADNAVEGRKGILEFLLINHPLDCPICDRGGECPLQDQTIKFGPGRSRFYEEKRHFKKPIPLGPVLMLDRERCIVCARCTRFGDLVAGDHALEFLERGYKTEVGTPDGGPARSKFIGNTIMLCPVGALTSQVYRFRARPWDNDVAESTCTLCPVGCSLYLDSRDGEIMRTRSRENSEVNDVWMCDKGWFGYEFVNHPDRLTRPLVRRNGNLEPATWEEALDLVASKMTTAKASGKIAGFGGDSLTLEENYYYQRLMRDVLGVNHVDHRIGTPIMSTEEEGLPPGMDMTIGDTEKLSFAVLLGLDVTEEFPVVWLRLKQAMNRGAKVVFIGHYAPEVAHHLTNNILHAPGQEMETLQKYLPEVMALAANGQKGAVFVGSQYLSSPNRRAILSLLSGMPVNIMEGRGNSIGARVAGMRPDVGAFNERLAESGLNAIKVLETASQSGWDYLHVAGANPATKFPAKLWKQARETLGFLVVQDLFLTETAQQADVVLPTLCFVEKRGHFMNIEGRLQKLNPGKDLPSGCYSDADIFTKLAERLNFSFALDDVLENQLRTARHVLPRPEKVQSAGQAPAAIDLAATFTHALFDHGVRMRHNHKLAQLTKDPCVRLNAKEAGKRSLKDGATVSITANGNSITAKLWVDARIADGTIAIPLGFSEVPTHDLGTNLLNGLPVELRGVSDA